MRRDDDGAVWVIRAVTDYDGIIGSAFDQIRQNGGVHPAVMICLTEAIGRLTPHASADAQRRPPLEQLEMVLAAGEETISARHGIAILRAKHQHARNRLDSA